MARSFASIAGGKVRSAKGLDDEALRDVYEAVTGVRSAKDFTLPQLGQVLDRLNRDHKGPMAHHPHVGKVKALWWSLYWLGEVRCDVGGVEAALDAFVKRQAKVDRLRFLSPRQAHSVIEALKAMLARAGVVWPVDAGTDGDVRAAAERAAVAQAIWQRLREAGAVRGPSYHDYAAAALRCGRSGWTTTEHDAVIRLLGKKLRRAAQLPGGDRDD